MTLKQEAAERMGSAPRWEMSTEPNTEGMSEVDHWLNNPTMQSRGVTTKSGIEKGLEQ